MKLLVEINEELLNYFKKYWLIGVNCNDRIDALVNSIKNATPITECEDCISKEKVLDILITNWQSQEGDDAMQSSINEITVLPIVYPKSDKSSGKWGNNLNNNAVAHIELVEEQGAKMESEE